MSDTVTVLADRAYAAWVDYLNNLGGPDRHGKFAAWQKAGKALAVALGSEGNPNYGAASGMVHEMRQRDKRQGGNR